MGRAPGLFTTANFPLHELFTDLFIQPKMVKQTTEDAQFDAEVKQCQQWFEVSQAIPFICPSP